MAADRLGESSPTKIFPAARQTEALGVSLLHDAPSRAAGPPGWNAHLNEVRYRFKQRHLVLFPSCFTRILDLGPLPPDMNDWPRNQNRPQIGTGRKYFSYSVFKTTSVPEVKQGSYKVSPMNEVFDYSTIRVERGG